MEKEKGVLVPVYLEFTGRPQESNSQANFPHTQVPWDILNLRKNQSPTEKKSAPIQADSCPSSSHSHIQDGKSPLTKKETTSGVEDTTDSFFLVL